MKRLVLSAVICLVAMFFSGAVKAQESDAKLTYIETQVWSGYLDDDGFVCSEDPVFQTDVYQELGGGFAFEFWTSIDPSSFREGEGSEVDYILSWGSEEILPNGLYLNAGVGYFDIPKLFSGTSGDIWQVSVEVGKNFDIGESLIISPFIRGEEYFSADTDNRKTLVSFGIDSLKEIKSISWSNKFKFTIDPGDEYSESGMILIYDGGLNFSINDIWGIDLLWKASAPLYEAQDREAEFVAGIGISIIF